MTLVPNSLVKMGGRALCVAAAAATLVACAGDPNEDLAVPATNPVYTLGAGDKVRIIVYGEDNLTGEYQVSDTGTVAFPLVGDVEAGGAHADEMESRLEEQLAEYIREPDVSVEVLSHRPFYIVGEVREPGSYAYVNNMTVLNAVAIAGGFTYRAREDDFYIQRRAGEESGKLNAGEMTAVMPGDVVIVRERWF